MNTENKSCPHEVGETFDVDLADLEIDVQENLRVRYAEKDLAGLATSISECGQIQPISVRWTGDKYRVVVGFRRALAMCRFRDLGFATIRATLVRDEDADLIRIAENVQRHDISLYEKSRYLYELRFGKSGRQRYLTRPIAKAVGASARHVRRLIRLYRVLPAEVHDAWAVDPSRFPMETLSHLADISDKGDSAGLRAALAEVLADDPATAEGASNRGRKRGAGTGRQTILRLAARLRSFGATALARDQKAATAYAVLVAVGNGRYDDVEALVDSLLEELRDTTTEAART